MQKPKFIISLLFMSSLLIAQKFVKVDTIENVIAHYTMVDGAINGKYKSYDLNTGNLYASGTIQNNQRVGKWTIYDSTEQKLYVRYYDAPLQAITLYPKSEASAEEPEYALNRNSLGYVEFFPLNEANLILNEKSLTVLDSSNIPFLFRESFLIKGLHQAALEKDFALYRDIALKTRVPYNEIITLLDTNQTISSIHLEERVIFDRDRKILEFRPYSLALIYKDQKEEHILAYIKYEEIRDVLNKIILPEFKRPMHIETVDDLFFFKYYQLPNSLSYIYWLEQENKIWEHLSSGK